MTVITLDAGGTNFEFSAIKDGKFIGEAIRLPSQAADLNRCLETMKNGFTQIIDTLDERPDAISFAFPGPADYERGIIGDLPNLPAFKGGGIALGPYLELEFKIPVFINNDGNLFALGESRQGFLKELNSGLKENGNTNQYENLVGITLGTGFGVGVSINGKMLKGDNNVAAEGWKLRNRHHNYSFIEDTVSTKALRRIYAEQIAIDPDQSPSPKEIYQIARGEKEGVQPAAIESYLRYGSALGDAIANILTIIDGAVVIGGGISNAYPLFKRTMMDELNGHFDLLNGQRSSRLVQKVFDIEDDWSAKKFFEPSIKEVEIPGSDVRVPYQDEKRIPVGVSKIGAEKAISLGAYFFAKEALSGK